MNVYDFDKTIFDGDSTAKFLMYCAKKHKKVRRMLPRIAVRGIGFGLGFIKKQDFKEDMFSFLSVINTAHELELFWDENMKGIKQWYKDNQREDDIVITASPEFLVKCATDRLGIKYIMGSPVDMNTGKYSGKNCHGEEKVVRFREAFPNAEIDDFFSDSYSDTPLAKIAKKAYLVKGDKLLDWDESKLK